MDSYESNAIIIINSDSTEPNNEMERGLVMPRGSVELNDDFSTARRRPTFAENIPITSIDTSTVKAAEGDKGEIDQLVNDNDDETLDGCPICFEQWSSSGDHRVCSLKCGHLFGKSCIETWLSNAARAKCPQCNTAACKKDIRCLYVRKLVALDTGVKEDLVTQIREERKTRLRIQEEATRWQLAYHLVNTELSMLKDQLAKSRAAEELACNRFALQNIKFKRAFTFEPGMMARTMDYDAAANMFLVGMSRPLVGINGGGTAGGSHSGKMFGIAKVSLLDAHRMERYPLHDQIIKCIAVSPHQNNLALSTGFDKTVKLSSTTSNAAVLSYSLDSPGWSCCFDYQNQNVLSVGTGNGGILSYDIRNTREVSREFRPEALQVSPTSSPKPVHSIFHCDIGFFYCTFQGPSVILNDPIGHTIIQGPQFFGLEQASSFSVQENKATDGVNRIFEWLLTLRSCAQNRLIQGEWNHGLRQWKCLKEITIPAVNNLMLRPSFFRRSPSELVLAGLHGSDVRLSILNSDYSEAEHRIISTNSTFPILETYLSPVENSNEKLMIGLLSERQLNIFL